MSSYYIIPRSNTTTLFSWLMFASVIDIITLTSSCFLCSPESDACDVFSGLSCPLIILYHGLIQQLYSKLVNFGQNRISTNTIIIIKNEEKRK